VVFSTSKEAAKTLARLQPRIRALFPDEREWQSFKSRLDAHFEPLFALLVSLYGNQYDFYYHLESTLTTLAKAFLARRPELRTLDESRPRNWFQSEQMMGGVCYVDLYAKNLAGIRERIPYFKELGLTYLHLMPLFECPPENNDGGYAVSNFHEVNPALGTMAELRDLADELRNNGISLVLDFVFNHTSDEHEWAERARAGDPEYQDYYLLFDDRTLPDQYERTLREIFPEQAPGSFTYLPLLNKWVWTTFNTYQWDLNYRNPAVFNSMLGEMLFLANQGVEVLRLDAVAFIWKEMGTTCENLPQAHDIIAAFNLCVRIAAPAMIFKSEAIVHPDDVVKYIGRECEISYNPTYMVLLWEAIATRKVALLRHSMAKRFALPRGTAWVNYIRSHDDIGWSFANEDAAEIWMNGEDHRRFLNAYYTGTFPGSFATGLPFNYNPRTGDMRINGTSASLAGLERALAAKDEVQIEHAIRRIVLIESMCIGIGGIPLIYLGDELGTLNDYTYRTDPAKSVDSRWIAYFCLSAAWSKCARRIRYSLPIRSRAGSTWANMSSP
jgi:amylosucrase